MQQHVHAQWCAHGSTVCTIAVCAGHGLGLERVSNLWLPHREWARIVEIAGHIVQNGQERVKQPIIIKMKSNIIKIMIIFQKNEPGSNGLLPGELIMELVPRTSDVLSHSNHVK